MSLQKQATAWVRVDLVPIVGDTLVWQAGVRPYSDAASYGGKKRGGIIEFGIVQRSLSDRSGSPVVATFSFTVFDRDGFWRGLQAAATPLSSQDVTFLLASVAAHTSEVAPRTLFRGQLLSPAPLANGGYRVQAQSRVGTRKGPCDADTSILKRAYNTTDHQKLPRQFDGKAIPALWGEESDLGTTNAAGEDISTGMIIPTACGPEFQGSTPGDPPIAPTYALPPSNLRVTFSDSGGTRIRATIGVSFVVEGGGETPVSILQVPNYMRSPDVFFGGGHEVYWAWDDLNAAGVVRRAKLWFSEGYVDWPIHWLDTNVSPDADSAQTSYTDDGDDHHDKRATTPPKTNTAQIAPGTPGTAGSSFFYEWLNLLCHPGEIISIDASDLAVGEANYTKITAADIGTDYSSGKAFLLGADGTGVTRIINGHCYFGFWARSGDGRLKAHLDGSMPFRVNLCGWHDDDGKVIDQAARVYLDVIVQQSGNAGAGYQSGARLTIPSYVSSPTVPIVQSTRFEATQDITKRYLDNDTGYLSAFYVDSFDVKWRDFETRMNRNFRFDSGETHHGQKFISTPDDEQDPTEGILLLERRDIRRVEDAGEVVDAEIYTIVRYQFDKHPITSEFRSGVIELRADPALIAAYGERILTLDMDCTRDPATAADAAQRWLIDSSAAQGPQYPAVVSDLKKGLEIELGTQYRIQHSDLITSGIRSMYLRQHGVNTTHGEVLLKGRDRAGTYALQAAPDVTTGTNSDDATAEELLLYAFATDENGRLPDGSFGSRAR